MKLFSRDHEWVEEVEDGEVLIGISDYAQDSLGDIVYVNLPEIGDEVEADEPMGDIESIKAVSDLVSPVDGEVLEINEEVLDAPELLNEDPENTWLVRVGDAELMDDLMDADEYDDYLDELDD